jgi:hypothetical protein
MEHLKNSALWKYTGIGVVSSYILFKLFRKVMILGPEVSGNYDLTGKVVIVTGFSYFSLKFLRKFKWNWFCNCRNSCRKGSHHCLCLQK